MRRPQSIALGIIVLAGSTGVFAYAQEVPVPDAGTAAAPDAPATESTYFDLRRSKDRLTQQLAERYFNLVRLQEWSSDKGTTIKAKYVSHAADLSSVTLSIAKGAGVARADKQVSVARLSKTSQSRVKQIATIQEKLDELIATGGKVEPDQPGGDPGAPMLDERGAEPPPRQPRTAARPPARTRRTERPASPPPAPPAVAAPVETPPADDGNPDPLGFGELPANPAQPLMISVPPNLGPEGPPNPIANDKAAWRTDYDAFRAALTPKSPAEPPQADLSPIKELKAAADFSRQLNDSGAADEQALFEKAKRFEKVGEFTWEATLTDADVSSGDWAARLNLPPLPAPLSIRFALDPDRGSGNWQNLQAGDRVKFIGRFNDVTAANEIVAIIHFPDEATTPNR